MALFTDGPPASIDDLTQVQQPRQVHGVAGVCLDPVAGRALQFRRCRDPALDAPPA
jgi:hypothetical protein